MAGGFLFRDGRCKVVNGGAFRVVLAFLAVRDWGEETSLLVIVMVAQVTLLSLVVSQVHGLAGLSRLVVSRSVGEESSKDKQATRLGLHWNPLVLFAPFASDGTILLLLSENTMDVGAGHDLKTAIGLSGGVDGEHGGRVGHLAKLNEGGSILVGREAFESMRNKYRGTSL